MPFSWLSEKLCTLPFLKKRILSLFAFLAVVLTALTAGYFHLATRSAALSGAPPYGEAESDVPSLNPWEVLQQTWKRPDGPPRIGLQIGHLENSEVPEELQNLRGNTGASAGGVTELEVNRLIAEKTAELLREQGVEVDILPATVPPGYWADAFIAVHADGNKDPSVSGFKIASPWRDLTGHSAELVQILEAIYQQETKLEKDPNITRNMRGYYAFAWWRYEHSIHPMTTAAIVETGFVTNRADRVLISSDPSLPAQALAKGILAYLHRRGLVPKES